jgi:AraC-like DNA-binding protein
MSYRIENRKYAFTASHIHDLIANPHIHPHLELIYLTKGSSLAIADKKTYELRAGEVFLTFPNQIHYYYPQEPLEGYMLIFSPDYFKDLSMLFQNKVSTDAIIKKEQLPSETEAVLKSIYTKKRSDFPLDKVIANGTTIAFLGELLSHMELIDKPGEPDSIKKILSYCMEHYKEPLTLNMLSKELFLSKYHISHIFHERMHTSFNDYINFLRVEYACELLKEKLPVTEAAFACGFSTVRTFNNAFKKHRDMTPRDYVKSHTSPR